MAAGADKSSRNSQSSCSVCLCPIVVTATGLVRQHGPVASRCPGSRQPPVWSASSDPPLATTTTTRSQDSEDSESQPPTLGFPLLPRTSGNIIKCLPRASRERAGRKLTAILEVIVRKNDHTSWNRLLCFSARCLRLPDRGGGHTRSLETAINNQLREESDQLSAPNRPSIRKSHSKSDERTAILAVRARQF